MVIEWTENIDGCFPGMQSTGSRIEAFKKNGWFVVGVLGYSSLVCDSVECRPESWKIFSDEGSVHDFCDVKKYRIQLPN